jgi:transcriptional regulator with XRE-family HTH domain
VRPRGPRTSAHIAHMIIEWISKEEAGVRLGVPGRPLSSRRVLELAREGKLQSQLVRDVDSGQMTTQIHAGSVERFRDVRNSPTMKESRMTIQEATHKLRDHLCLSQQAMAARLGVSFQALRNYEGGKTLSPEGRAIASYMRLAEISDRPDLAAAFETALDRTLGIPTQNGTGRQVRELREPRAPQPSQALALLREVCEGLRAAPSARLWLTLNEAADYSGLPAAVLLNFITLKKIQVLNVGRRRGGQWRIRRLDLDQFAG